MSSCRRVTSRRRSGGTGRLLGAVKLQSPLGEGSDAGSPCSSSSAPASALATPLDQSPLVTGRGAAVPAQAAVATVAAAAEGVAQFSQQLTSSRSADRWLEEQERLAPSGTAPGRSRQHQLSLLPQPPQPGVSPHGHHVESAASQIVHKALRFITADGTPVVPPEEGKRTTGFDSQSFLDKGMDAISGVGRLMEGFAITLDNVIGQAFEEWASPHASSGRGKPPLGRRASGTAAAAGSRAPAAAAATLRPAQPAAKPGAQQQPTQRHDFSWPEFDAKDKENGGGQGAPAARPSSASATRSTGASSGSGACRQPHITSFMSKLDAASEQEVQEWRKRAQQLATELQRMRAQQEEYQRLRLQYDKMQAELRQAATQASRLAQENSALKTRGLPPGADPALADPLAAQQVARQMEALLAEKSKLVAENDRLLRENSGLQELLEFTLVHQAQLVGDGELFDELEAVELAAAAGGAALAGSPAGGAEEPGMGAAPAVAVPATA